MNVPVPARYEARTSTKYIHNSLKGLYKKKKKEKKGEPTEDEAKDNQ
jgi:hypothetical protein